MAFAQFYYDPALEFEKLLDEDTGGVSAAQAQAQASAAPIATAGDAKVAKSTDHGAIARSTSMTAAEPQPEQSDRWFGEGLLRRCASTGSIHGGTHPGIPK
ncbi:uncharacterized protein TRAVEDRAFT_67885 [Trametes versicolor FP-101664 SS1]|uniref:uncharacterized protein n=1 Tax=Trametes versicolor (strain FP-101664) TaxID=717944 RepID=UPI00046216F6|nr:uncharacterized protein TRAVEDRAFT_67885 [Trametes versicolor FP-101664 SS1]EIW63944.1 hypothetical protein TRAVEDRAFT_67885 [Trametes versicolor FP-101664 SS1]